jgi:WD40 repeat protein
MIEDVAWSPDDACVATCGRDGFATVWDAATGESKARIDCRGSEALGSDAQTVDWHADGRLLVGGLAMSRIWRNAQDHRSGPRGRARWRPHHQTMAVGNVEGGLLFLDDAFNLIKEVKSAHERYVYSLAWSPDGSRLATCSVDEDLKIWTANGQIAAAITGAGAGSLAWNPQGTLLACGEDRLTIRDAQTLGIVHEVSSPKTLLGSETEHGLGYSSGVAWSPDGQVLAVGTFGKVFLLPVALLQSADAEELIGFAKRHITSALSAEEVRLFFKGEPPGFD